MSRKKQREAIGQQLRSQREKGGKSYNDVPMNYRTVKNMEDGTRPYGVDNLLEYMEKIEMKEIKISTEPDETDCKTDD